VQLDLNVGAGEAPTLHGGEVRGVRGAPVGVLLARLVAAVQAVPLVADDLVDLGVGELAPGILPPRRHGTRGAALAADVAAGAVWLTGVGLVAGVDEAELVGDVAERLLDLAVVQRVADPALAIGPVAGRALAGEEHLAGADRAGERLGRRLQAAGVEVAPQG